MKKRQISLMIAALVSICAVISVVSALIAIVNTQKAGASFPVGMLLMALVTVFCTVMIWRGVRDEGKE